MMCFWVYNIGTCIPIPQKHPEISRFLCLYSLLFSCVYKLLFNHLMTLVLTKQWQMKRNVFVYFLLFLVIFGCIWFAWKMLTFLRYYLAWARLLYVAVVFVMMNENGFFDPNKAIRARKIYIHSHATNRARLTAFFCLPIGFIYICKLIPVINDVERCTWDWTNCGY